MCCSTTFIHEGAADEAPGLPEEPITGQRSGTGTSGNRGYFRSVNSQLNLAK